MTGCGPSDRVRRITSEHLALPCRLSQVSGAGGCLSFCSMRCSSLNRTSIESGSDWRAKPIHTVGSVEIEESRRHVFVGAADRKSYTQNMGKQIAMDRGFKRRGSATGNCIITVREGAPEISCGKPYAP